MLDDMIGSFRTIGSKNDEQRMRTIDAHLHLQFLHYTLRAYPRGRILACAGGKSVQRHMVSENAGTVYILRDLFFADARSSPSWNTHSHECRL